MIQNVLRIHKRFFEGEKISKFDRSRKKMSIGDRNCSIFPKIFSLKFSSLHMWDAVFKTLRKVFINKVKNFCSIFDSAEKNCFQNKTFSQHVPHEECRIFQYCIKSLGNTQKDFSFFVRPGMIKKIRSLNIFSHQNVFSRHVESSCETVSEKLLPKGPKKLLENNAKNSF